MAKEKLGHFTLRIPKSIRNQLNLIAQAECASPSSIARRILKKNLPRELAKASHNIDFDQLTEGAQ